MLICGPAPTDVTVNGVQIFNKATLAWEGTAQAQPLPGLLGQYTFTYYPFLHELATGDVFASVVPAAGRDPQQRLYGLSAHANASTWPPTAWTVQAYTSRITNAQQQTTSLEFPNSVLRHYRLPRTIQDETVTVIGGVDQNDMYVPNVGRLATASVWEITNPTGANPGSWANPLLYGSLTHARVFANALILPDLTLMVVGGSGNHFKPYAATSGVPEPQVDPAVVYVPEKLDLLNPSAGWSTLTPHTSPRLYHSVALLLADGRVLVGSGYKSTTTLPPLQHTDAEVYNPPYLLGGHARPELKMITPPSQAPITYGTQITLQVSVAGFANPADEIDFVTLLRCNSVTHHQTGDTRCVRMDIETRTQNTITLSALPSRTPTPPQQGGDLIAPPGYYLLFVVRKPTGPIPQVRVPSVGEFVKIQ